MLVDRFGREISYLRISVTDRCNLGCVYCVPPRGIRHIQRRDLLSREEIIRVVAASAELGVRKFRLTGGEPLVRADVVQIVRAISNVPGIDDVSLTTNGMLLEKLAAPLADAGLKRVNISLDTLDREKFKRLTRSGDLNRVLRGIRAAEKASLHPIKINTVVIRGVNDDELLDFARLTSTHSLHVRFIELMPVGNLGDWGDGFPPSDHRFISVHEMLNRLASLDLVPTEGPEGNGPSRYYKISGVEGTLGFISPIGEHFCATCNRIRLTADGRLRACLLKPGEIALRDVLMNEDEIKERIHACAALKPEGHGLGLLGEPPVLERTMCQIGG